MSKQEFDDAPEFHTGDADSFWRQIYLSALRGTIEWDAERNPRQTGSAEAITKGCANLADASLVEWKARGRLRDK